MHGGHHRRRRLPQGRHRAAEGQRGRGDRPHLIGPALRRRQAHRRRGRLDGGSGPLVPRPRRRASRRRPIRSRWTPRTSSTCSTPPAPRPSRRGSCTPPAATWSGTSATHRYIFDIKPERRVLVHGRHRLGDRPLLHRLRPARERDDRDHLRGRHRLPRQGPMGPDRGQVPRHDPVHRPDRHPRADEVRPRGVRRRRPLVAAPARLASASRSTRRRGPGTGSTSAASAARWSTRGGRPRPA